MKMVNELKKIHGKSRFAAKECFLRRKIFNLLSIIDIFLPMIIMENERFSNVIHEKGRK